MWLAGGELLCGEFWGARRLAGNTSRCSVDSVCGVVNEKRAGQNKDKWVVKDFGEQRCVC